MENFVEVTLNDGKTKVIVNLDPIEDIHPMGTGSRLTFCSGRHLDLQESLDEMTLKVGMKPVTK